MSFLKTVSAPSPDLLILNADLPDGESFQLLKKIRSSISLQGLPVVMISDQNNVRNKITAFEKGADDYLIRPFDTIELIVRIKAILRRVPKSTDEKYIRIGEMKIYPVWHKVIIDNKPVNLTPKEFDTLLLLINNPKTVFSKEQLQKKIWGCEYIETSRTIDVHIYTLRKKLGRYGSLIKTLRGIGYCLAEDIEKYTEQ